MTVERRVDATAADTESTGLIRRVNAPLPPYAQQAAPASPAPQPAPAGNGAPLPPPQTMADAMIEVSTPPLADDRPLLIKHEAAPPTAPPAPPARPVSIAKATPPAPVTAPVATPVSVAVESAPSVAPVALAPPLATQVLAPTPVLAPALAAEIATTVATPVLATTTAATMPPPATEFITCPECGTTASVTLNRRDSVDFCRTCDYPLFWTPSKIIRDPSDSSDESLRRLPGTVGRATVASLACPFCYEPNGLSAQTCVRCGKPMHPVVEIAPQPVYVPPPAPELPAPKAKVGWWVWAMLALTAVALIGLVVLITTHTID
jgi:hypothetical protein